MSTMTTYVISLPSDPYRGLIYLLILVSDELINRLHPLNPSVGQHCDHILSRSHDLIQTTKPVRDGNYGMSVLCEHLIDDSPHDRLCLGINGRSCLVQEQYRLRGNVSVRANWGHENFSAKNCSC